MNFRPILSLLLAGALSLPITHARAQEPAAPPVAPVEAPVTETDEPAADSKAAGIVLPETVPKARRVLLKSAVDTLSAQLTMLAKNAGIPLGAPEVLSWGGPDYKPEQAKDVIAKMTEALKADGFDYRQMGKSVPAEGSTTTIFTANNDKKQSMLLGYWVEGEQMLVLVWGALEEPGADAFPGQPAPPAQPKAPAK
jgi:hypothetical protein